MKGIAETSSKNKNNPPTQEREVLYWNEDEGKEVYSINASASHSNYIVPVKYEMFLANYPHDRRNKF